MGLPIYKAQFNRAYWSPDYNIGSIAFISPEMLKEQGIKGVAFDVDQTLCGHHGIRVDPSLETALEGFVETFGNSRIGIISNTSSLLRRLELEYMFPYFYLTQAATKKPRPDAFREIESKFGLQPSQLAFFGDLTMTDIVGANNAGWVSVKVKPLAPQTDPIGHRIQRIIDSALYAFA